MITKALSLLYLLSYYVPGCGNLYGRALRKWPGRPHAGRETPVLELVNLNRFRDYVGRFPVVFRGAASKWPATEWTIETLLRVIGMNTTVPCRINTDKLTKSFAANILMRQFVAHLQLGQHVAIVHAEDLIRAAGLDADLDLAWLNRMAKTKRFAPGVKSLQMFVASAGTHTGYHCNYGANFYVQLTGRKKWWLVSPDQMHLLYPMVRGDIQDARSPVDSRDGANHAGDPLYWQADTLVTTLEPGDVLYFPDWWWHSVNTLEQSISVACWSMHRPISNNKLFGPMWALSPRTWKTLASVAIHGRGSDKAVGAKAILGDELSA